MAEDTDGESVWITSESRAVIVRGLLSGQITPQMKPKQIQSLNPSEHAKWTTTKNSYNNWAKRVGTLRKSYALDHSRMLEDIKAYGHDLQIVKGKRTATDKPAFHRSAAFQLLKQDIKDGALFDKKPKELWQSREEYFLMFGLREFRKHIYQELDSESKRAIRFEKKKKKWKYPELHKDHPRLKTGSNDSDSFESSDEEDAKNSVDE